MKFVEITPDEFQDFAAKSPYKSFMQTTEIATLREKNGWTPYFLAATDNNTIKAATLLLAKPTFLGKSTFIAPGGPLLDFEDIKLATFFLANLKKYVKTHNGYVLNISPYYELKARDRNGAMLEGGFNFENSLKVLKFLNFREISHPSQPKYMFAFDIDNRTPEELMANFKSNTRNHIKKAEKMGVKIRELQKSELNILKQITESTSKRRNFTDQPLSYYEQMYDLFCPQNNAKFLVAEAVLEGDKHPTPLSAAMFLLYGDEAVYLFSGSDEKYMRDYNAQYLIQWHMIEYAASHHFKRYNFYGISGLPKDGELDGIYEFKKGFASGESGHVLEYIGTYETPISQPFFTLHHLLSKLKH